MIKKKNKSIIVSAINDLKYLKKEKNKKIYINYKYAKYIKSIDNNNNLNFYIFDNNYQYLIKFDSILEKLDQNKNIFSFFDNTELRNLNFKTGLFKRCSFKKIEKNNIFFNNEELLNNYQDKEIIDDLIFLRYLTLNNNYVELYNIDIFKKMNLLKENHIKNKNYIFFLKTLDKFKFHIKDFIKSDNPHLKKDYEKFRNLFNSFFEKKINYHRIIK